MKTKNKLWIFVIMALVTMSACTENEMAQPETEVGAWETVMSNSLSDYTTFEANWNYLYPWGSDHNGSARMYGSSSDHNHIYLSSNTLNIKATRINWDEGSSSEPPNLAINYHSGAIHSKHEITINDQYPDYEVKGEFQAPSGNATWPAFWLTGIDSWPPEIDIMEFKGSAEVWQNTYDGSWQTKKTWVTSPGNWHEYKVWITKTSSTDIDIHFYIDGSWKAVHTVSNFVNKPMTLIVNLQMEGSSGSSGPSSDTFLAGRNIYIGRTKAY